MARPVAIALSLLAPGAWLAGAEPIEVTSSAALRQAARRAAPGTTFLLPPGTYRGPCKLTDIKGAAGKPVRIAAKDPNDPPVFVGGDVAFQLIGCRYVWVDGLVATGATANNVQVGDGSHHVVLKDVISRDIKGRGNCDGIKMPGLTDFLAYGCTVSRWGGEGSAVDMVGCARGLFVHCRFTYPNCSGSTANGIQPKGGTHAVGVYRCRFDDASHRAVQFGGATGRRYFFQNNYDQGYEAYDVHACGNIITAGGAAVAFVSCTRCTFECNTMVRPRKYVARVLKEGGTRPTSGNLFAGNLIVHGRLGQVLNHGPNVDLASHVFRDNYWYNRSAPNRSVPRLPVSQESPAGGRDPQLDERFQPADNSPARAYGARAAALERAWAKHAGKFRWAWNHAQRLRRQGP